MLAQPKPVRPERAKPKPIPRRARIARTAAPKRTARPNKVKPGPLGAAEREADRLWSLIVMAEADGMCIPCHRLFGERHAADDPMHLVSRRYQGTKHLPSNGVSACRKMHRRLGDHPPGREWSKAKEFGAMLRGAFVFETLERLALRQTKFEPVTLVLLRSRAKQMGIDTKGSR